MAQFNGIFPPDELVAAPCGILSVATVLTHTDRPDDSRWISGYTVSSIGAPTVRILSSALGTVENGGLYDGTGMPRNFDVKPFFIEVETKNTGLKIRTEDPIGTSKKQIEAATQKAIERELWDGVTAKAEDSDNPYLSRAVADKGPVILSSGTGVSPKKALSMLEGAISNSPTGGGGVIHMTRETAAAIVGGGIGYREDPQGDGLLLTSLGTPVVVGSGYTGSGPDGSTDATPSGATRWAYVTGPVTVHLGPIQSVNDSIAQGFNPRTNDSTVTALRPAAVHFDTTIFYAVEITLPDVP